MGTKPKHWPDQRKDWPANHSNAARDRDEAALDAAEIRRLARIGLQCIAGEKADPTYMLYLLARIDGKSSDILRILEKHGAPTTPTR